MRRTAAGRLLDALARDGSYSYTEIAVWIAVDPATLDACREGAPLPLDRQLALADAVIHRVPRLSRLAHALRGQTEAALDFHQQATVRHLVAPPTRHW
jgi:hypothetical protein